MKWVQQGRLSRAKTESAGCSLASGLKATDRHGRLVGSGVKVKEDRVSPKAGGRGRWRKMLLIDCFLCQREERGP